jgi:hypothetical protein
MSTPQFYLGISIVPSGQISFFATTSTSHYVAG